VSAKKNGKFRTNTILPLSLYQNKNPNVNAVRKFKVLRSMSFLFGGGAFWVCAVARPGFVLSTTVDQNSV